jgi:molybdopterin-containing oxidoreductase family iron-sulfur binding subunit
MSTLKDKLTGPAYWRSLDELADTPEFNEFMAREFPAGATEMLGETTRRGFLRIMGASLALAGVGMASGCRWPKEKIMPYSYRPEGVIDGQPNFYATSMELGGVSTGLVVTAYDGRPTKVEGNPEHPGSLGSVSALHLASILEMYDPDRSQTPLNKGATKSAEEFIGLAGGHFAEIRGNKGKGLTVLSEATSSPSVARMRQKMAQTMPLAKWYEYEALADDNERLGTSLAFGSPQRVHYRLDKAAVVFSADSDYLGTHPNQIRHNRDWATRRLPSGTTPMSRTYQVEGVLTITGASADHRLPVRSSQVPMVLMQLAGELGTYGLNVHGISGADAAAASDLPENWQQFVKAAARDLSQAGGAGLVTVGPNQAPSVHALAYLINSALGSVGNTIYYTPEANPQRQGSLADIKSLTDALNGGQVETLVVLGGNPVYNAPRDLKFADALGKAGTSIHLSTYNDETSRACTWHLPKSHYLESWGDGRAWDGTVTIVQPLIAPLYSSWAPVELLSVICEETPRSAYEIVRETVKPQLAQRGEFEQQWELALNKGMVDGTAIPGAGLPVAPQPWGDIVRASTAAPDKGSIELVLREDYSLYDGRFANLGWLQELPDPVSKITWDNPLYLGVKTAADLGVANGELVTLQTDAGSVDAAVMILPGMAPGQGSIALGYGRLKLGKVANAVGFDSYNLRGSGGLNVVIAKVTPLGKEYRLATTQDHFAIDLVGLRERNERVGELVREMTLDEFNANPAHVKDLGPEVPPYSLWVEPAEDINHKWGMAIDLTLCTGCSACVTACQSENNIPVVGKRLVRQNREMHWIRIDRYYRGDAEQPQVMHQPVTCHHCETAPCEQVCPVAATTHSSEGLNQMVYNRCIGTRYCSNNCPYKVRRFNFFAYNRKIKPIEKMRMNPEVTVRSRGVMEKCTFCVQRIQNVKIRAKNEGRPIADGEITPACAQACPTHAIAFGDLNNPNSRVSQLFAGSRTYGMLTEINTQPRLNYLARVKNTDSTLVPASVGAPMDRNEPGEELQG